ncbi:MAG: FKBP-type peptidyl-prolyl cis-trans isomerase [Deltaproteobacteria bacterium]|nr:FKBP-type peptidyl-prolyl cis-trans isomerase [Deltaproteobacteria bacterium]MBW2537195.1 FKBP-type peptidyl-prolyl cis-trans isomerase [Deltaproteobacteria bacterium]
MAEVEQGSTILIGYSIRLDDGRQVDRSSRDAPLMIKLGEGKLFPSVEQALVGLSVGEEVTVRVEASEAFGPHDPGLVREMDRVDLPTDAELEVGGYLGTRSPDRSLLRLLITKVEGSSITLDGNHPLAGKALTVVVQVISLV